MEKFEVLKNTFQDVIDCIIQKNAEDAQIKLVLAREMMNEMLDLSITDDDLLVLRQFQLLHVQLEELVTLLN